MVTIQDGEEVAILMYCKSWIEEDGTIIFIIHEICQMYKGVVNLNLPLSKYYEPNHWCFNDLILNVNVSYIEWEDQFFTNSDGMHMLLFVKYCTCYTKQNFITLEEELTGMRYILNYMVLPIEMYNYMNKSSIDRILKDLKSNNPTKINFNHFNSYIIQEHSKYIKHEKTRQT